MSRNHRGKRNPLTASQLNQQKALRYYINISAYHDKQKQEIINTLTESDNQEILGLVFGVYDSAVVPSNGFDGCVLFRNIRYDGESVIQTPYILRMEDITYSK